MTIDDSYVMWLAALSLHSLDVSGFPQAAPDDRRRELARETVVEKFELPDGPD